LLEITPDDLEETREPIEAAERSLPTCARCEIPMVCIEQQARPSWKQVFERDIYADPTLYSPMPPCTTSSSDFPLLTPSIEYG
jgi:hypothetical protein